MNHKSGFNALSRTSSHRRAMLRNMVTSLFRYPPMSSDQALDFLFDYLIPGDYDPNPESSKQVNTYIVHTILMKYSKKYRREIRECAKKHRKIKRRSK